MRQAIALAAFATLTACASIAAEPAKIQGGVLTNSVGMTLYTFDNDPSGAGKSVCVAECAAKWPPLIATGNDKASGEYSLITRHDGSQQWAYRGKPLYLWVKDRKPGDMSGDGVKGVWHVDKP